MDPSKNRRIVFALAAGALLALAMMFLAFQPGRAAGSWYVSPGGDDGNNCLSPATPCATINGAIGKVDSGDTIYVAVGTYIGTGDEVVLLDKDATLSGGWDAGFAAQSGISTIDGEAARRGITVSYSVTAIVERFSIRNGYGGGISNEGGTLTLNSCTISYNTGGGIGSRGTLTLNDSVVTGNTADYGGGVYSGDYYSYCSVTLNNSTISNNTASVNGGGVLNNGGQYHSSVTLNNSTVSGNTAGASGGGFYNHQGTLTLTNSTIADNTAGENGGGIYNRWGDVNLHNTILAGNAALSGPDCSLSAIESLGYNLIGNTSGCTFNPGTGDLTDVDADLGSLLGPTGAPWYHPLFPGSPAIDAIPVAQCTVATDQRGVARPQGSGCDMGAYEYTAPGPPASIHAYGGTPQHALTSSAFDMPLQAAVLDSIGSPVSNTLVTFFAPASGASGTFSDSGTYTTSAVTDDGAVATAATFTANELEGSYTVTATVSGVVTPAIFLLNNVGFYVAPGGSDSSDCLSPTTACASINGAMGKARSGDTIYVAVGTYTGTGDEVVLVDKDVTLSGGWDETFITQGGTSTIDGEGARRGMTVSGGVTASLERFTVRNGSGGDGVGIHNEGDLSLDDSTVNGNSAAGSGGGVFNGGALTLNRSSVTGNAATYSGGGIFNDGTLALNSSTVSGNTTGLSGGGIYNQGTLALNSSTISRNTAAASPESGSGGGIRNDGIVALQNVILAGNYASFEGPDCLGTIDSLGYNLIGRTLGCSFTPTTGDLIDLDAELFILVGLPGYHPLLPGSPAIDAGNPAGCTDHMGDPLTTDQRGTPRSLDGDGDGDAICDMGAYEFDPENPFTLHKVFLPLYTRNFYPDFFDDFSDPTSGWTVVDDSYVRTEYLNGEYRVLTKQSGYFYLFSAPTYDRQNYTVEVDARWDGPPGSSYGLIFGVTGGYGQYYLFDMNTDYQQFRLLRRDPSGFVMVVPITYSSAINGGSFSNHLKVTRNGDGITLEINGTVLGTWYDGTIGGLTGAGLVTNPYNDTPTSDARFDNFSVVTLLGGGASVPDSGSVTPDEIEFVAPNARRDPVPASMAW